MGNIEIDETTHHRPIEYVKAYLAAILAGLFLLFLFCLLFIHVLFSPGDIGSFMGETFTTFLILVGILLCTGVLVGMRIGSHKNRLMTQAEEKAFLENRMRTAKVRQAEKVPDVSEAIILKALQLGLPVEYSASGNVKVTPLYPNLHTLGGPSEQLTLGAPMPETLPLPGPVLAKDVLRSFDLRSDHFFLALGKGNQHLACTLDGFMHTAHDSSTGGGKTSQQRIEIVQHLKLGVYVILAFPHFAPVTEDGEDWRPIARAIEQQGILQLAPGVQVSGLMRKAETILKVLQWLSTSELERRYSLRERGDFSYPPIVMFIDELPYLAEVCPELPGYLVDVLQRGRVVKVRVNTSAQSYLVGTIKTNGSARENFNTVYYMGGSDYSGATLLDMPQREMKPLLQHEQVTLGRGIALLRNNESVPSAQLVRLPYADNEFVYYMLGHADDWQLPSLRKRSQAAPPRQSDETMPTRTLIEGTIQPLALEPAFHHESERLRGALLQVYKAWQHLKTTNRRALAAHTGISLGKVQSLIQELIHRGYIQE